VDAGIYARLSKNRSRKRLSDSVKVQIAEAQTYTKEKLWPVIVVESDDDISASKYSKKPRPCYDRLIAAVEAGRVEVIIVTEMPRLYRRMEELLELIKMAERTRLRGIWTTDDMGYDLSTPEGIHASIAAINNAMLESARLSRRQKRMKAQYAREGKYNGGGRPYGYDKTGMELVPEEVAILVEAKDRYLAGETMRDIVRDFYHRGVVSPYGKPWQIENFQRALLSKRYLGILVHDGSEYPALWPAIFTPEEWARMDARRIERTKLFPGKRKGTGRQYLLTGLVYCGRCGTYMIGSRRKLKGGYQRRYKCRAVDSYGLPLGCGRVYRGADPLDAFITEAVLYRFDTPEVARLLANGEGKDNTDDLIADYQEAKAKLDQMVADYASGFLTRDEFAVAKQVAEDRLQATRHALGQAQARKVPGFPASSNLIRESWDNAGLDWRHSVIKLLVEKIVCLPGHPGSRRWREWRFDPQYTEIVWRV